MLMDELKKEIKQNKFWNPMNGIGIKNHPYFLQQQQQQQAGTQISFGHDFNVHVHQCLKEDHLYIKERSGSCSAETIKRQRDFDLERCDDQGEAGAGPSSYAEAFQSCKISNDDIGSDEDMEVDLTLCIGSSNKKKMKKKKKSYMLPLGCKDSPNNKTREFNSSVSFQSDRVGDCSDPTTPMSSSSVTFDQEKKGGPHWLIPQGLRLK